MNVIIAEKPSLAKAISIAIPEKFIKKDGYLQGQFTCITWAFGHLFELKDIEDYKPEYRGKKWDEIPLPYCPDNFSFKLKNDSKTKKTDKGIYKQYNIISNLINNNDTKEIICAGDADREGEVIIRIILHYGLKNKKNKKITRLWLPEQTPKGIYNAYTNRKEIYKYDNLFKEGLARTYLDWLLGINLSRALSVRAKTSLSVGRVICPIVKTIYDRELQIRNFKPKKYIQLESNELFPLVSHIKYEVDDIQDSINRRNIYNEVPATVLKINKKRQVIQAPKLYSLSKLQGEAGQKFKYSPKFTLSIVQNLYEKGLVSYPRTNTEFLSENEKEKIKELIQIHGKGYCEFKDSKRIFDDSKIESHSALTPTYQKCNENLTQEEKNIYHLILSRFLAVFWKEPFITDITQVEVEVGHNQTKEIIKVKGSQIVNKGWNIVEQIPTKDIILPNLQEGQSLHVQFECMSKVTQPPKKYTVSSLNQYLKNPLKKNENIDEEYKNLFLGCEIGTEATRADIIDKAIKKNYISLKKNTYSIEEKGVFLIDMLNKLKIDVSVNQTIELQKKLKKIYHNEACIKDVIKDATMYLENMLSTTSAIEVIEYQNNVQNEVGNCPWCNKPIFRRKGKHGNFYSHISKDSNCSFIIGNSIKIYGQSISLNEKQIHELLEHKSITKTLISKAGKPYKISLSLNNEPHVYNQTKYPDFKVEFKKNFK